jgi:hypothetical protein
MIDEMEPFAAAVTKSWRRGRWLGLREGAALGLIVGIIIGLLL